MYLVSMYIIGCDEEEFQCRRTFQCIQNDYSCDRHKACDDGSNEELYGSYVIVHKEITFF